jgi:hypothetical protein
MLDPADKRAAPQAALAQQAPPKVEPAVASISGERFRILEHKGRGAYASAPGRYAVLDLERDPLARDLMNQYAHRVQAQDTALAEAIWQTLFDTDPAFQAHMQALGNQGDG